MNQKRLRVYGATPRQKYYYPILRELLSNPSGLSNSDIKEAIFTEFKESFNNIDKLPLKNGSPRWNRNLEWEKQDMKNEGVIIQDKTTGKWKITSVGTECYNRSLHRN